MGKLHILGLEKKNDFIFSVSSDHEIPLPLSNQLKHNLSLSLSLAVLASILSRMHHYCIAKRVSQQCAVATH